MADAIDLELILIHRAANRLGRSLKLLHDARKSSPGAILGLVSDFAVS
jgi:hypothetical protein